MQSHILEVLFEGMKTSLYNESGHPFPRATIAVPSYGLKRWLSHRLAKEWGIFFGIDIVTLEQLVSTLSQKKQPTSYESALAIYPLLKGIEELGPYFEATEKSEVGLANEIATLFTRYGVYGQGKIQGWQKKLWDALPPYWFDLLKRCEMEEGRSYHLFGFSYIPPLFLNYLRGVHLWIFSPSSTYFADVEMNVLGYLSKEMQKQLQDLDIDLDALHPVMEPKSCLERLQKDLVLMEKSEPSIDDSIQLHACVTKQKEIEVLFNWLHEEDVDPKEVVVMAPDITPYIPYIKALFDRPMIFDREKGAQNPYWQLLQDLMELRKGRLERDKVLALFEHAPFNRKWGLSSEDISLIKRWVEEAGIYWGTSPYKGETRGTWSEGLKWLMDHLILYHGEESLLHDLVPLSKAQNLGVLCDIIHALSSGFTMEGATLLEWHAHFKNLIETHMPAVDEEHYHDLVQAVEALLVPYPSLHDNRYPFEMMWDRIKSVMEEKSGVEGENELSAIPFSSLSTFRATPKKWIYILGMNEGVFPRISPKSTLDLLTSTPEKKDEDRAIFLETLLSCRKKLVLSYISGEETARSSLIDTLVDHLGGELKEKLLSLDPLPRKEEKPFLLPSVRKEKEIILVEDLLTAVSDPLKNFFKESLEFKLAKIEVEDEAIEPLQFSALDRYSLRQLVRHKGSLEVLQKMGNKLPFGPYYSLALEEIEKTKELVEGFDEVWDVEFRATCTKKECLGKHKVLLPPLVFGDVVIEGVLKHVAPEGILCDEKGSLNDHLKNWPKLLLAFFIEGVEPKLIYPRTGKTFDVKPENPEKSLLKLIDFYHLTLEKPAITYPEWGGYLLKQPKEEAVKKIKASLKQDAFQRVSPYREYSLRATDFSEENISYWQKRYQETFLEVL